MECLGAQSDALPYLRLRRCRKRGEEHFASPLVLRRPPSGIALYRHNTSKIKRMVNRFDLVNIHRLVCSSGKMYINQRGINALLTQFSLLA